MTSQTTFMKTEMNRMLIMTVAVIALVGCATTPPSSESRRGMARLTAADESAVRAVVLEFANTWNQHDMNAMHNLDTEDVEWINVVGQDWRGKTNVYKGHTAIHQQVPVTVMNPGAKGMSAGSSMSVESATIRSIAPSVAVAVATMHFGASPDPRYSWVVAAKTRGSFTLVKRNGIWKIVHFQNTVIDPKAENDDLTK